MTGTPRRSGRSKPGDGGRLSLHPLSLDDALRGAMLTGPPPEAPKRTRKPKADAAPAAPPSDAGREEAAEQVRAAGRKAGEKARRKKRPQAPA